MRKMLKMIRENILFFLEMMTLIVILVATAFVPNMAYALYIVYAFMVVDVYLLVNDTVSRIIQIITLLLCVFSVVVGQVQNSAAMMFIMHPLALAAWLGEYIMYLNLKKMKKA